MKWTYELFSELQDLVYSLEALENNYYDTHDLEHIETTRDEIESRIDYLTEKLPTTNTHIGDYSWDFNKNEIVNLNNI